MRYCVYSDLAFDGAPYFLQMGELDLAAFYCPDFRDKFTIFTLQILTRLFNLKILKICYESVIN